MKSKPHFAALVLFLASIALGCTATRAAAHHSC